MARFRKRSRMENEVLEILQRAESLPPKPIALRTSTDRAMWRTRLRGRGLVDRAGASLRSGGWSVIVGGIIVAIFANIAIEPISHLFASLLLYAGVVMIGIGFVQLYRGSAGSSGPKTWRGRRMDLDRGGPDWEDKADQWRRRR